MRKRTEGVVVSHTVRCGHAHRRGTDPGAVIGPAEPAEESGMSSAAMARVALLVIFVLLVAGLLLFCLWHRWRKRRFPIGPCRKLKRNLPNWRDLPVWICSKGDVEG